MNSGNSDRRTWTANRNQDFMWLKAHSASAAVAPARLPHCRGVPRTTYITGFRKIWRMTWVKLVWRQPPSKKRNWQRRTYAATQ